MNENGSKRERGTAEAHRPSRSLELQTRWMRPPLERMKKIYDWLQADGFPNCARLAERLEVSRNTIKRDIRFLRDRFQWPIAYEKLRRGYYFTEPVDGFPALPMSEAEMFALLVAHKAIEQYQGTPFLRPLRAAFEKLTARLEGQERCLLSHLDEALSFRPFAPEETDLRIFEAVTQALTERRVLRFHYKKPGTHAAEPRRAHPYFLTCINNAWYLMAHDVDREELRTFALARVSVPVVTDERFERPDSFDPEQRLRTSFGVMSGEADYEVVIEFDAWAADMLLRRHWHASQQVTVVPGGGCHLRLRLSRLEEIERWILSWGIHATVIRPTELAGRIVAVSRELERRYRGF
ncbi:Helix-turn-helix, type 11 domain protein [Verrucomicrobia bacterium]|nr:Helix-turn-helix, type 11 domain protein [Verrucomicrobiota bacterium]